MIHNLDYSRYKGLKLNKKDGIMTITLSNPTRRNAVTAEQQEELIQIWEDVWADNEVRVIIIQGDGKDFCAGADVAFLNEKSRTEEISPVNSTSRSAKKHVYGIMDCEKPVIAKVRGVAYGMGVNIALACDLVYAAEGARFCDSHVKVGLVAGDGGVLLWPLLCGMRHAKEALMLGDPIPAEEAARIGLINRVLPDDKLDAHVDEVARKLLDLPPHAVNYTKASLNVALKQMTAAAFEMSLAYEIYTFRTNDFGEATQSFLEKRKGKFKGN